ncbi:SDR family NAD(P)-dependent oxidoreductase [Rummeliibacillus pycnus]|uniref:SDR family NAD(P)-dependent oxidoreductase n=1 Tax=Rummeliibacillus pycnus TaxID=101070 RepID=UPI003D27B21C
MKHALVIGGTGMLSGVSLWLNEQGYKVSIIARNKEKMQLLINQALEPTKIIPNYVDYTDTHILANCLDTLIQKHGPVDMVVAWIHSKAKSTLPTLIKHLKSDKEWSFYHVLGSSREIPTVEEIGAPTSCNYATIQLGFIRENNRSRWLTNDEISNGVKRVMQHSNSGNWTVGRLEPQQSRP